MKKSTLMLAAMGIVAGLGCASLPFSANAAKTGIKYVDGTGTDIDTATEDDPITKYETEEANGKVSGNVLVKTTIDSVLSITIEGTNDTTTSNIVLLSAAGKTDGKIMNGGNGTGAASVTVATNNLKGYNVSLKGATAELVGTENATEKIPAIGEAKAAITTTSSDGSEWGYKVTTADANFTAAASVTAGSVNGKKIIENYQPVTTAGAVIINSGAATENAGDAFTLTFGVHASESQAADTYTDTITLTAAANNA